MICMNCNEMLLPAMGALVGVVVFILVWRPIYKLLSANSRLAAARAFFVRTLLVVLVIGAIAPVIGSGSKPAEGQAFMEFVWQQAQHLGESLLAVSLYLFGFVVVMTILASALGRGSDK